MHCAPFPTCRTPTCRSIPAPGYADRGLCGPCEHVGLDAIHSLADDHERLGPLMWEKPAAGVAATGGAFGPSDPVNVAVVDLVAEIEYTVALWEEITRDRARLSPVPGRRWQISRACTVLGNHYSALLATPPWPVVDYTRTITTMDGPDAVVWLTRLHHRATARIGDTALTIELPGLCPAPDCGWPSLRHHDSADTMWCEHCRRRWPWNEYAAYVDLVTLGETR
jgi:hypothetical protein